MARRLMRYLFLGILVSLAGLGGAAGLAVTWAWWHFPLPDLRAPMGPVLRLYAGAEEIAAFQGTSRRSQTWVPLSHIPGRMVDAVLAAEDHRFFRHRGIDPLGVLRAVLTDLWHLELRQGASTISQQLARSLYLSPERSWERKVREAAIALWIEMRFPKERILEAYLNSVYMGHDEDMPVLGLAAAARHYLGKDLAAVRLDEAAFLAAAIQAPNRVFGGDPAVGRARRDAVLRAMHAHGRIGEEAAREAMARPIGRRPAVKRLRAPYFVDLARREIARRVTLSPSGEVRVATALDPTLQWAAEAAIGRGVQQIERRRPRLGRGRVQAALVAIEPASGEIRALVGGRRYLESPYNRATRAARQPGSLFKPIVYLASFEARVGGGEPLLTPASLVADEPLTLGDGAQTWSPQNPDGQFRGPVTVRRALEESLNVPAVRVAQHVGLARVAAVARALGIQSPLAPVPSLALGTSEVTLLEMTAAFATLANGGVRATPTTLAAMSGPDGSSSAVPLPPPTRAVSAESAFLVTHLLRGVMRDGTGRSSARWGLNDVTAGKTGSTDGLRDAWFVGYTPDLAMGVWVGLDDGTPLGLAGAEAALPIWASVMEAAVRRAPPRPFTPPPGIVMASVDRDTGRAAGFWCGRGAAIEEAFLAGTQPLGGCAPSIPGRVGRGLLDWIRSWFR